MMPLHLQKDPHAESWNKYKTVKDLIHLRLIGIRNGGFNFGESAFRENLIWVSAGQGRSGQVPHLPQISDGDTHGGFQSENFPPNCNSCSL